MLPNFLSKFSFFLLLFTVILLPVFFLPFTKIPVEVSKGLLLVSGLLLSVIFWAISRFYDGKIKFPKSPLLLSGLMVVLISLLSALFGSVAKVSLFGLMFDVGSFWFIFSGFLLMFLCSMFFSTPMKAQVVLMGTIIVSAVVLVFQTLHLFFPEVLTLTVLGSKTSNLFGSFTSLGFFAAFSALLMLYVVEFFSVSKLIKFLLMIFTLFALFIIASVNFLLIWELLGVFALIIFVYKISIYSQEEKEEKEEKEGKRNFPFASFALVLVSLLFLMSSQFIGGLLPNYLDIQNNEARPSFGATMMVTKEVLKDSPILGIGPNRFGEAWAMYKPVTINSTLFVDTFFDSGSGLLPTLFATTGILGILSWLLFFGAYLFTGVKLFFSSLKNGLKGAHGVAPAFFISSLFLFAVCFFYPVGIVMFILALAFAGICAGLYKESGEVIITFAEDSRKSFISMLFLTLLLIASVAVGYKYYERFASVVYFRKALLAPSLEVATPAIIKAYLLHQNDLYFRTYAETSLLTLSSIVDKGASLSDEDKALLQNAYQEAIGSARLAVQYDKGNYLNHQMLGNVHNVAGNLGVKGAHEEAIKAFTEASRLNPSNPGLKLALARINATLKNTKEAKDFATQALNLKPDYIDALIVLSQIAKGENNLNDAISYAEQAVRLDPDNKDLIQYLNSLKSSE